ncbi:manganese ABC transporter ATP-binding protein [Lujinxingia litoralis]|uniref:Manganese ABC transporter ATP-binding protein n=1 Tax=Lujinxingia litoralis TaxID=2211119 RepID=A0A328CBR3_9DELT|nr:metal ABC transporter ATP-binding protein [Lujinxingia litoralis]RAL23567.1 manganese ABC transporter ATP-binding protein [Lujinxingia litoralis]
MSTQLALEIRDLSLSYGVVRAVEDVNLNIEQGRLVGIIGPNGAGKSTLIKAIAGAKDPDHGTIRIVGETGRAGRRKLTYVPQRGAVDWDFPISAEGVVRQGRFGGLGLLRRFGKADRRAVQDALDAVAMTSLKDRQIGELSGGQQQRVFLARALAQGGEVFLMDEPFAGVDAATEKAIMAVLRELRDAGKTVLVVHHDLVTVADYFDEIVLLNRTTVAHGPTSRVFTPENMRATYGGHLAIFDAQSQIEAVE